MIPFDCDIYGTVGHVCLPEIDYKLMLKWNYFKAYVDIQSKILTIKKVVGVLNGKKIKENQGQLFTL